MKRDHILSTPTREQNKLLYALRLSKAVKLVVDALNENFTDWKSINFADKKVIKNMEKTHQLVIDYIYGLLGGKMNELANQALKGIKK